MPFLRRVSDRGGRQTIIPGNLIHYPTLDVKTWPPLFVFNETRLKTLICIHCLLLGSLAKLHIILANAKREEKIFLLK